MGLRLMQVDITHTVVFCSVSVVLKFMSAVLPSSQPQPVRSRRPSHGSKSSYGSQNGLAPRCRAYLASSCA